MIYNNIKNLILCVFFISIYNYCSLSKIAYSRELEQCQEFRNLGFIIASSDIDSNDSIINKSDSKVELFLITSLIWNCEKLVNRKGYFNGPLP